MKLWFESRTIWLQVVQAANAILIFDHEVKMFPFKLPDKLLAALTALVAIATVIVRLDTTKAIKKKDA